MIGYIGLSLLLAAYIFLLTPKSSWFIPIDIIASVILTVHAITLGDIPFIVVNGFISIILTIKYLKKETI
jgi:hypothetical protein